ncbi:hypothetical protein Hypma_002943 [Hypsizygus marmoreus]|uniref:Uncharacterized protein n=1 Tax=Hypsizygus marmoreus TaxID=39966 RepID=A0A369JAA0_HYPMA|nr:hypothetical protein Hypma_002943 [Hypsizygus marmoreus]
MMEVERTIRRDARPPEKRYGMHRRSSRGQATDEPCVLIDDRSTSNNGVPGHYIGVSSLMCTTSVYDPIVPLTIPLTSTCIDVIPLAKAQKLPHERIGPADARCRVHGVRESPSGSTHDVSGITSAFLHMKL